jgi:CMP-N-acetylneuraminic acid synthetase
MSSQPEVLALVPARGGSKGIPRKNLRELAGRPLVAWTISAGLGARTVNRLVCSTDDDDIAAAARAAGAEVPFMRPVHLATDTTPDLPVLTHALQQLAADGYRPDAVVWLRPTAPLVIGQDIDAAVDLLLGTGADAVRSICPAEHHPYWTRRLEGDTLLPFVDGGGPQLLRQSLPAAFRLNGAVDVVRTTAIPASGSPFDAGDVRGYVMPPERSIDIDSELDFRLAELVLGREDG